MQVLFLEIRKIVNNSIHQIWSLPKEPLAMDFLPPYLELNLLLLRNKELPIYGQQHLFYIPSKKRIQEYAFKKADLIHAWGPAMIPAMKKAKVDLNKVLSITQRY
jgi:hypothetical protein